MTYPDWYRPLKRNPEFNRNVMYGRHPVGFRLLDQEPVTLRCADCKHCIRVSRSKTWHKCRLSNYSFTARTDISTHWAACEKFVPANG